MTVISRLTAAFAVVLFAMLAVAPLPAEGQGSVESDRAALVALYDATGGDNWTDNHGWKTDLPLESWSGVGVGSTGRVVSLYLSERNLTGELPRELGSLTTLEELGINYNNNLTGEIPRELGNLTNLEGLSLSDNNLIGAIPPELGTLRPGHDHGRSRRQVVEPEGSVLGDRHVGHDVSRMLHRDRDEGADGLPGRHVGHRAAQDRRRRQGDPELQSRRGGQRRRAVPNPRAVTVTTPKLPPANSK